MWPVCLGALKLLSAITSASMGGLQGPAASLRLMLKIDLRKVVSSIEFSYDSLNWSREAVCTVMEPRDNLAPLE